MKENFVGLFLYYKIKILRTITRKYFLHLEKGNTNIGELSLLRIEVILACQKRGHERRQGLSQNSKNINAIYENYIYSFAKILLI